MKNDPPISQRERPVPPGEILVAQTDRDGVITYANSTFAEVSGYGIEELVGVSHRLVRHPDVPAAVFEQMWHVLNLGGIWQGVLKNRCRNGDHYWTEALVMPLREGETVTGYMSVRRQARREDVEVAERRFAGLRAGKSNASVAGRFRLDRWLSIRSGIVLAIAAVMILLLGAAAVGAVIMARAEQAMSDIRREAVDGGATLGRIQFLMADNRAQVLLGAMRDTRSSLAARIDRVNAGRAEIESNWPALRAAIKPGRTAELADEYWAARTRYAEQGLQAATRALAAGDYTAAGRLVADRVNPLYDAANAKAAALVAQMKKTAAETVDNERAWHERVEIWMTRTLAAALPALIAAGILFLRHVVRPIEERIGDLGRMSDGNLTARIDTAGGGEIGRFNRAFAATQAQLQCLLDHLSRDATQVSAESAKLRTLAVTINEGIDEQYGRVHRIVDCIAAARLTANELAGRTGSFMSGCAVAAGAIEQVGVAGTADACGLADAIAHELDDLAVTVATDSRVLAAMVAEIERDAERIAGFLLDHREAMHDLWRATDNLSGAAADLEKSANRFEIA